MDMHKLLLRPHEAGDAIGVSRAKIYMLIASGDIPAIRVGNSLRVPVAALQAWIARQLEQHSAAK
jgi:excisionase family DNA binding protein